MDRMMKMLKPPDPCYQGGLESSIGVGWSDYGYFEKQCSCLEYKQASKRALLLLLPLTLQAC